MYLITVKLSFYMSELVFISHNSKDKEIAREIGLFLSAEGISVWFDEWEIDYGESIPEKVDDGLRLCTHFLLIWSKNAADSKWVGSELSAMINSILSDHKGIRIIPICLDDTPLPRLVAHLKYIQHNRGDEKERFEIIKAVTGKSASRSYIQAIVKKFHEVTYDSDSGKILAFRACPNCGSTRLKRSCATDYEHDEEYFFIECNDCGWSEWTQ